jgi:hypothetical protein
MKAIAHIKRPTREWSRKEQGCLKNESQGGRRGKATDEQGEVKEKAQTEKLKSTTSLNSSGRETKSM